MSASVFDAAAAANNQQHRYHFNNVGVVKDILYPNKAIINFKLNGKDEKAILLSNKLTVDGKVVDDNRLLSDIVKIGDVIEFDCHIYDKGGIGSGKDKCNFFAMRAWRNSKEYIAKHGGETRPEINVNRSNMKIGTGWISELNPRKGVLTFDNGGRDERVLFLASKVYLFEKRLGAKQPLTDFLAEADPVQFEAVPQESESDQTYHCSWFANLVWKGKRPAVDEAALLGPAPTLTVAGFIEGRRGSVGSTGSEPNLCCEDGVASVEKGVGVIARIVNERSGIIWCIRNYNHYESVWFEAKQTFMLGTNLADKNLKDVFKDGDPVSVLIEAPPEKFPTKWIAKQVLVTNTIAKEVARMRLPPVTLKKSVEEALDRAAAAAAAAAAMSTGEAESQEAD